MYRAAIHIEQKRAIAVKIFSVPFGGTLESRTDFANEWETLKSLSHPAIAQLLRRRIRKHGCLSGA